ncbi:MAG: DUF2075 domain-containing protein [Patescibacteria group bacterium]
MRLYSGTSKEFILDNIQNRIADLLRDAFFSHFRYYPSPAEVTSWRNSLRALSQVFQHADLIDHGILLEYQLPLTSKRLDCIICGVDTNAQDTAMIIELKQWEKTEQADGENEVLTWVGGAKREVLHPSAQVGGYKEYLADTHTTFYEGPQPVRLEACSYLHNYNPVSNDELFSPKFSNLVDKYPVFTAEKVDELCAYLLQGLERGNGESVMSKIDNGKYKPSRKLLDHISSVIKGKSEYVLLDEQRIVFDKVMALARRGLDTSDGRKILIVRGGPGTGKSVIALNLMADLLAEGKNAHYATGSKAFTETLRKIIGTRGSVQFKYFNSYASAGPGDIDVLICDEAHRIRKTSNNRFTRKDKTSNKLQIEELLDASKLAVFFIDDNQIVRPNEIGSVSYIREYAKEKGREVLEYELEAQFRCNGSDAFINWVNNTLGIKRTANPIWDQNDGFEFKIFDTPEALEQAIKEKAEHGNTARLTAGFCWPWSSATNEGALVDDVVIGDYQRPWNAKTDSRRLVAGIPKASLWAHDPQGVNQIGCVYTAQGFEFDYVGVIIGEDLVYDFEKQNWIARPEHSFDTVVRRSKDQFVELLKNTYRILLTRGMKGCYVYFVNKETEKFFRSRIDANGTWEEDIS